MHSPKNSSSHIPPAHQTRNNILAIWSNRIFAIISPLILTPIITHNLGLKQTGIWLMATQLVALLMLFDAGLTNSLVRYLAGERANQNPTGASRYLSTGFIFLASVSLILLCFYSAFGDDILSAINKNRLSESNIGDLLFITVLYVSISLPLRTGQAMIASMHRFDIGQLFDLAFGIIRLTMILAIFYFYKLNIYQLGVIVYGTLLISAACIFLAGLKLCSHITLRPTYFSITILKNLFSMAGASVIVSLSAALLVQSTPMITGYIAGPAAVLGIAIPILIFNSITPFSSTLPLIMSPIAAGMSAMGDTKHLYQLFVSSVHYHAIASSLIFLITLFLGNLLIGLWLSGPELGDGEIRKITAGTIVLMAGFSISSIGQLGRSVLSSVGKHWGVAITEFSTAMAGILIGFYLTSTNEFGTLGILIGISITLALRSLICYPILLGRYFSASPLQMILRTSGVSFAFCIISALVGLSMGQVIFYYFLINVSHIEILEAVTSVFSLCLLAWFFVIPLEHRASLKNSATKAFRRP